MGMALPRLAILVLLMASSASAERLRVAFLNTEVSQRGPGLLLQTIRRGDNPQVTALAGVVRDVQPDILVLAGIDYDHGGLALAALADDLAARGAPVYPHRFALRPNTGVPTGFDMDGDGRLGGPRDAQGYGNFNGADGLAILSRYPVDRDGLRDFSAFLWTDLPGNLIESDTIPAGAERIQRLATTAFWEVPVSLPGGRSLRILTYHASPPVFDGPEDRNGRRNHDETAFWNALLSGRLPVPAPQPPFVLAGDTNLDPTDGDGRSSAIRALLSHPALRDPLPESPGGASAGQDDPDHRGNPALDTADLPGKDDPERPGPGNLRTDYVLPSADLSVTASGVHWPVGSGESEALAASRHRMVWVDIDLP